METPLRGRHEALGGRMVEFAGWVLPVQYEGVLAEHRHCRMSAVVFDTSHMGQFLIRGQDAPQSLGRICTQDAEALAIGRCRYGFLLDENAGILDDTILMRLGSDEFLLVVNAGTAPGDLRWLQEHLCGVELTSLSAEGWGKLDLQGPLAAEVLRGHTDADLPALRYFAVARCRCFGRQVTLSRTGYTGELGYEIMAAAADLPAIFEELLADGRVRPAGLGARDSLRLEMGYPLYGHELDRQHNPAEAGLEVFAKPDRGFPGAAALRKVLAAGPTRKLAAFRAESRRRPNSGNPILHDGAAVGTVTSGAFAPSLDCSIGMGYVEPTLARAGEALVVDTGRAELPVVVADRPLYTGGTCRMKIS